MENEILTIRQQQEKEDAELTTTKNMRDYLIQEACKELLDELQEIKGLPQSVYGACLNLLNALNK